MTSQEIANAVSVANQIGKPKGLSCEYAYDRKKCAFVFKFWRNTGIVKTRLGSTANVKQVITKMQKYMEAK